MEYVKEMDEFIDIIICHKSKLNKQFKQAHNP